MSVKYKVEKFGKEVQPYAFITDFRLTRKWNAKDESWTTTVYVLADVYEDSEKTKFVENQTFRFNIDNSKTNSDNYKLAAALTTRVYKEIVKRLPEGVES